MKSFMIEMEDIGEALFLENKSISPLHTKQVELGLWCELSEDGLFYQMEILNGDRNIQETLNWDIQEARRLNIPGRYDVPELGLKDATFVEVLEAIRDYYTRKFKQKTSQKSPKLPAAA